MGTEQGWEDLGPPLPQSGLGPGTEGAAPTPGSQGCPFLLPPTHWLRKKSPKLSGPSASLPHPSTPHYPTGSGAELATLYQEGSVFKDRAVRTPKTQCANGGVSGTVCDTGVPLLAGTPPCLRGHSSLLHVGGGPTGCLGPGPATPTSACLGGCPPSPPLYLRVCFMISIFNASAL